MKTMQIRPISLQENAEYFTYSWKKVCYINIAFNGRIKTELSTLWIDIFHCFPLPFFSPFPLILIIPANVFCSKAKNQKKKKKKDTNEIVQLPNLNHHLNITWFFTGDMKVWGSAGLQNGKCPKLKACKRPPKGKIHTVCTETVTTSAVHSQLPNLGAIRQNSLEIPKDAQHILKYSNCKICLNGCSR